MKNAKMYRVESRGPRGQRFDHVVDSLQAAIDRANWAILLGCRVVIRPERQMDLVRFVDGLGVAQRIQASAREVAL